jgi:hypothetical protein
MNKRGQPLKEIKTKMRAFRMLNAHWIKFMARGGVKRLRELLDSDLF